MCKMVVINVQAIILYILLFPMCITCSLRILLIFHTSTRSHFAIGDALINGLTEAGHEITSISMFPSSKKVNNFRHIDITGSDLHIKEKIDNYLEKHEHTVFEKLIKLCNRGLELTNATLNDPAVQRLMADKDEHFDLVIAQMFASEALIGFGQHFKAPVIVISTVGTIKCLNDIVGTPSPLSYVVHPMLSFTDKMDFRQRIINTIVGIFEHIYTELVHLPQQSAIYDKMFPNPKPSLTELRKNVSLVLVNTHFSIGFPRPYVPNMIEIGGIQVNRINSPLPVNLKNILDAATDGAIYFSFGSNIKSTLLPQTTKQSIIKTFAKLKKTVLMKWEDATLSGKPDNVFVKDWFPQNDVLAHPNVKCLITHGGLLSITEAIYHGVPIIGIPVFGDQHLNMAKAQADGYGIIINYSNLTEQSLEWALTEILHNKRYTEQVKKLSAIYRDQPMNPLDTAVYWVEYVARHKGAAHMKSAAMELDWISYHNVDVLACLILATALIIAVFFMIIKFVKIMFEKLFNLITRRPTAKIVKSE